MSYWECKGLLFGDNVKFGDLGVLGNYNLIFVKKYLLNIMLCKTCLCLQCGQLNLSYLLYRFNIYMDLNLGYMWSICFHSVHHQWALHEGV